MTDERQLITQPHARVSYPIFTDASAPAAAQEMNAFYVTLREAVLAYAVQLNQSREGGVRTVTAEYRVQTTGTRTTVEYIIYIRRRGRTEGRRHLAHTWEGGALILPEKKSRLPWKRQAKKKGQS